MERNTANPHHRDVSKTMGVIEDNLQSVIQSIRELGNNVEALGYAIRDDEEEVDELSETRGSSTFFSQALWLVGQLSPRQSVSSRNLPFGIPKRIRDLEETNQSLRAAKQVIEQEKKDREDQLLALQTCLGEAEAQKHKLQQQNTKLKGIIIKSGNDNNEVLDSQIIKLFSGLRDQIQKIVHKDYATQRPTTLYHGHGLYLSQMELRHINSSLSEPECRFRIRAKLFAVIYDNILAKPCFGLRSHEMESGLIEFENALRQRNGGPSQMQIAEWRSQTVECAALLNGSSTTPAHIAGYIWEFMEPWLSESADREIHQQALVQLCTAAYELALLLRKSKATYKVVKFEEGQLIHEATERSMIAQAFEGPTLPEVQGSKIAFTLFGAMLKSADTELDEEYILEKAHVICKA